MNRTVLSLMLLAFLCKGMAQTDTIYQAGKKTPCTFWGTKNGVVSYCLPGSTEMKSIKFREIDSLFQKSGKVIRWVNDFKTESLKSALNFHLVAITDYPPDVEKMKKVGETMAKATGKTFWSKDEKVKEKAYKAFQLWAAMQGGNVILVSREKTRVGTMPVSDGFGPSSPQTDITGLVYSDQVPGFTTFREKTGGRQKFTASETQVATRNSPDITRNSLPREVTIENVSEKEGLVNIRASVTGIDAKNFRLVLLTGQYFILMDSDERMIRNIVVPL